MVTIEVTVIRSNCFKGIRWYKWFSRWRQVFLTRCILPAALALVMSVLDVNCDTKLKYSGLCSLVHALTHWWAECRILHTVQRRGSGTRTRSPAKITPSTTTRVYWCVRKGSKLEGILELSFGNELVMYSFKIWRDSSLSVNDFTTLTWLSVIFHPVSQQSC